MTALFPNLGRGLGLRREHYRHVVETRPAVDWFEVITENFMVAGGNPRRVLEAVRRDYPIVLHGVSLSIGSTDPLDEAIWTAWTRWRAPSSRPGSPTTSRGGRPTG